MTHKLELGRRGEVIAQRFLIGKDYKILERNWISERVEIDIIAEKEETIIFVEVKTRSSSLYGDPEDAVNKSKQENIFRAAEAYLDEKSIDEEIRFDIISIIIEGNKQKIYHIEDAISPYDE